MLIVGLLTGWRLMLISALIHRGGRDTMKSARERAEAAYYEAADALDREDAIEALERMFKEHTRDQRRLCAQRMGRLAEMYAGDGIANEQHLVQMASTIAENASAPGEA